MRLSANRPGLTVRTHAPLVVKAAAGPQAEEREIVASLRSPVPATAIPLRVAVYALREEQGENVRVLVSGEVGREPLPGLVVACALFDESGRAAASTVQRARDEGGSRSGPTPFSAVLSVPPGHLPARLATGRAAGRRIGQAVVPVAGLTPGDYVARATVSVAGSPIGTARHPFRVTAP